MPCVLPVLSLKLLGVVGHGGARAPTVRASFLATAAGIVASFLAAGRGARRRSRRPAMRSAGASSSSSRCSSALMALVLTLFAANLWGWFEIRLPAAAAPARAVPGPRTATASPAPSSPAPSRRCWRRRARRRSSAPPSASRCRAARRDRRDLRRARASAWRCPIWPSPPCRRWPAACRGPGAGWSALRAVLGLALLGTALWLLCVLAAQIGARRRSRSPSLVVLLAVLWLERAARRGRAGVRLALAGAVLALGRVAAARFLRPAPVADAAAADAGWQPFDRAAIDAAGRRGQGGVRRRHRRLVHHLPGQQAAGARRAARWPRACAAPRRRRHARRLDAARPRASPTTWRASAATAFRSTSVYGPGAPTALPLPELLSGDAVLAALDPGRRRRRAARRITLFGAGVKFPAQTRYRVARPRVLRGPEFSKPHQGKDASQ